MVLAGTFAGTALLPMKFGVAWRFENTWLVYSVLAYLCAPWIVAITTVPHLSEVYGAVGLRTCLVTALFGAGWGLAIVLNGIGVAMVGLSLSSALLMGSSIALGSLLPLLLKNENRIGTREGLLVLTVDLVMLAGVLLCARAGYLRGRIPTSTNEPARPATRGILICLAAGLLSTLFNGALAYGESISREALARGATGFNSANAIWSLAVSAGSVPGVCWCVSRLFKERTWRVFGKHPVRNTSLCVFMALLWIAGTVLYGAATGLIGSLGTAIGWPVYMSGIILTSNFWGLVTGEWRGVSRVPARYMLAGVGVQILAILILGQTRQW